MVDEGYLFEDDTMLVEFLCDASGVLYLGCYRITQSLKLTDFSHQGHQTVAVMDYKLVVTSFKLHQSATHLQTYGSMIRNNSKY